ncbi:2-aminoethanethiol dioxygenase isoform X1 [Nematostella vectensis]|uniref:2-aminoethanethiol dioxygenase isoform X1 n=1 Tax=Nematostella vectensis TaxID=45351 RepID=UPI002077869F|nr:2-aminoethanethiol dioxygenase isoform X1 [Nematostella vectensis]
MAAIQRLAKQAFQTFKAIESPGFPNNLEKLKDLMDRITASDVDLVAPETSDTSINIRNEAPVSHIAIYECPFFSMGIFIVKKGCHIPLHDHPGMYGLCKVLYGSIKVESYHITDDSQLSNQFPLGYGGIVKRIPLHFVREKERRFDASGGTCVLTPQGGNFHAVHAMPGPTAFLDILAPPYSPERGRDCTYFKECDPPKSYQAQDNNSTEDNERWLIPIPPPREFYCDSQEYTGPEVIL